MPRCQCCKHTSLNILGTSKPRVLERATCFGSSGGQACTIRGSDRPWVKLLPGLQKYAKPWPRTTKSSPEGHYHTYLPRPPNVPLLRALWSLLDGIWGFLKGSWGVLVEGPERAGTSPHDPGSSPKGSKYPCFTQRLQSSSFWFMTYFLLRDYSIQPKKGTTFEPLGPYPFLLVTVLGTRVLKLGPSVF